MASGKRYAKVYRDIHQDGDWRDLTADAQWLYVHLLSQPALSNAGVLPLLVTKWARGARDMTVARVQAALVELGRHLVRVDEETDELLVRSYIRNDIAPMGTPHMLTSALRAALSVESNALRMVLLDQIRRLDRELKADHVALVEQLTASVQDRRSEGFADGSGDGSGDGFGEGFVEGFGEGSVEVVVTSVGTSPSGVTHFGEARKTARTAPMDAEPAPPSNDPPPSKASRADRGTRLPEGWRPPDDVWAAMAAECPDLDLDWHHRKFVNYWLDKSGANARKVTWVRTWENWMRDEWQKLPAQRRAAQAQVPSAAERKRSEHADVWALLDNDPSLKPVPSLRELGQ